jgi:hypothetical protein
MADPAELPDVSGLTPFLQTYRAVGDLKQHVQQQGLQNEFIKQRAALGENPSIDQLTGLATRFANPTDLLHYGLASQDKNAALLATITHHNSLIDEKLKQLDLTEKLGTARLNSVDAQNAFKNGIDMMKVELQKVKNENDRMKAEFNKPPSGYRPTAEGNLEAIPGGPADVKQQGILNQDTASFNEYNSAMDRLQNSASSLKEHPGLPGITGLRGALPNIPGTSAAGAQALLNSIEPQVAFGVLQNMRNNSKSGGALGQVSNQEEQMLKNALVPLGRAQSTEDFKKALQGIMDYAKGAKERLSASYNMKHSGSSGNKRLKFDAQGNLVQ